MSGSGDKSQRFRNVVVLLNDCSAESAVLEMLRRPEDCLLEIWVCSKGFMSAAYLGLPVAGVSQSGEQSEVES